jgi:prepilin-type N-terminal cleavage/methylation domain-containing protein
MNVMSSQRGFVLIELIAVIVLIGMIAAFTTFFLYTGFKGYEDSKTRNEGALSAQMALDRITLELRDINYIDPTPNNTSLTYKSETLTGTRTLKYIGNNILLNVDPPGDVAKDYTLLEDVTSFQFSYTYLNLDYDTAPVDEVASIAVVFNLSNIGKRFETKIFPRYMVPKTW